MIGDSAFRLSEFLMKPFPFSTAASEEQRAYNYNLSKSRRVVENAFGQLKARFRRIGKGVDNHIKNATIIIKAACVLHNYLNQENDLINNMWLEIQNKYEKSANRQQPDEAFCLDYNSSAQEIRNCLANYIFNTNET